MYVESTYCTVFRSEKKERTNERTHLDACLRSRREKLDRYEGLASIILFLDKIDDLRVRIGAAHGLELLAYSKKL